MIVFFPKRAGRKRLSEVQGKEQPREAQKSKDFQKALGELVLVDRDLFRFLKFCSMYLPEQASTTHQTDLNRLSKEDKKSQ